MSNFRSALKRLWLYHLQLYFRFLTRAFYTSMFTRRFHYTRIQTSPSGTCVTIWLWRNGLSRNIVTSPPQISSNIIALHSVRKKRPWFFLHNFYQCRHKCVIFGVNHPEAHSTKKIENLFLILSHQYVIRNDVITCRLHGKDTTIFRLITVEN